MEVTIEHAMQIKEQIHTQLCVRWQGLSAVDIFPHGNDEYAMEFADARCHYVPADTLVEIDFQRTKTRMILLRNRRVEKHLRSMLILSQYEQAQKAE